MKERLQRGRKEVNRIMKGEGVKGMKGFCIEGKRDKVKE